MKKIIGVFLTLGLILGGAIVPSFNAKAIVKNNDDAKAVLTTTDGQQIEVDIVSRNKNVKTKVKNVMNGIEHEILVEPSKTKSNIKIEFDLNEGEYIKIAKDEYGNSTNSANIFNKNGDSIAVVLIPVVEPENSNDVDIETSVENDNVLNIAVESTDQNAIIGIQSLSYSYSDYFKSGKWITRDGLVSLSLDPKKLVYQNFSNPNVYAAIGVDSWNKVLNKHSSHSNWKNTKQMKNQYDCHRQYAQGLKTPWNLEPARPLVSYAETVRYACNNPIK